jgi:hypothetical protein
MDGHDRIQLIDASECNGEICYVSMDLVKKYMLVPQAGKTRITWRKLDGDTFTHTLCEVLERSRIKGEADLILGKDRKKQEWNDCETVKEVIELSRTRLQPKALEQFEEQRNALLSIMNGKELPDMVQSSWPTENTAQSVAFASAHQDLESLPEGLSDVEFSSASSSDDSSATTVTGSIRERKEQIIGGIVRAVTQWLGSQFIQAHNSANETTSQSTDCGSTPSGASEQPLRDQAKPAGKRKLGERNDEGENDDDYTIRPPHSGATDKKGKGAEVLRFACPYFKYNPTKYQGWPVCPGPGWLDVHRVK